VRNARATDLGAGQRHVLGLFLALLAARNARLRRPSPPVDALAGFLGLPVETVADIVVDLTRAGLATQGQGADGSRFAPLPPDEDVRVSELVRALDGADSPLPAAFAAIDILPALRDELASGNDSNSLKELLARHGALLEKLPATLLAA
jgi:DNA-binding IscR family transcriptional regulator